MEGFLLKKGMEALKVAERLERLSVAGDAGMGERLLPAVHASMSEGVENTLSEETAIREAKLKLKEIRKWLSHRKINPRYFLDKDFRRNCGSSAYALWRRLNDADVDAVATRTNVASEAEEMELITGLKVRDTSPEEIEKILRARGPGAHMIVGVKRFHRPGHWFNAYFDGEQVWTMDGMKGKIWEWPHNYGDIKSWQAVL